MNIHDLILKLEDGAYYMIYGYNVTKTDLLLLVEKNELETDFFGMFSQAIFIQRWFPIIFTTSLVPFIVVCLFLTDAKKKVQFFSKWKFLKILVISILYVIIPLVVWIAQHLYPKDFYEFKREGNYMFRSITATHVFDLKAKHNDKFFSDLLIQSEHMLDEMIPKSYGFGDCAGRGRYPMSPPSREFIFYLKINLMNLRSLSMDKKLFVLSAAPLLLHFHIKYCFP